MPLALAATVAPASATTFNAQPVPGTRFLNEVACPTSTTCVAAGQFDDALGQSRGVLVPITNGVPGAPQVVVGTGTLNGVACSDATTCVTVGSFTDFSFVTHAVVVPFTIANGSLVVGSTQTLPDAAVLNSVACYSATSCVAVGGPVSLRSVVVTITNGTAGPAQFVANVRRGLTGVACYSPTACTAVGLQVVGLTNDGVLVPITNGTAGVAQIVGPTRSLTRIACRPSFCQATGIRDVTPRFPIILPVVNGVPGTLQPVPSDSIFITPLLGISCPTDTLCASVGNTNPGSALVPVRSGLPAAPQPIPATDALFGIACTTTAATSCIAVGTNPDGTVGVVVTVLFEVPVANNDAYTHYGSDTPLVVPAPGVLGNDTDAENDPMTASLVSGPSQGTLTLNPDGSFTYQPVEDFVGVVSFTYKVNDGTGDSNVATATITVGAGCRGMAATLTGTNGNNLLNGTPLPDVIAGLGGNDLIDGARGNDVICGGSGRDTIYSEDGDDYANGGTGDDNVQGGAGNDSLVGGIGNDKVIGDGGDDVADGGAGDDHMEGNGGNDTLVGGLGNDYMEGSAGNDTMSGGDGADKVIGLAGDDSVDGGAGDDYVEGSGGNDAVSGGDGVDWVTGDGGNDVLSGGAGSPDRCDGGAGIDSLAVGHGCEVITGVP